MENRDDILNELNELSPLIAGMEKVNVFTVPAGYFDRVSNDVLICIKEESGELLSSINSKPFMQVPQGYFDSLADNILNKIKAADDAATELRSLSPMLYSIQNENVFTVPEGYFESLPGSIMQTVKPQQAKVVFMHKRSFTFIWYAVAAVFTAVLALGVYKFTGTVTGNKNNLPGYVTAGLKIQNFDEELSKISDEDIIKYLQANGNDVDAALVANTIDENELPSQEDYFTDDKALDKYLDNININDLKN